MEVTFLEPIDSPILQQGRHWGISGQWIWKGFKCHWRHLGQDKHPPLVLIHGFGASSSHWRKNAADLVEAGFKVYALDLIGFGYSDQISADKHIRFDNQFWAMQLVAFLEQIVDTQRFGKAVLVGNSLGGLVGLTTAAMRPELVSAVVAAPLPDPAFLRPKSSIRRDWIIKLKNQVINILFRFFPFELLLFLVTSTPLLRIGLQAAYYRTINTDKELFDLVFQPARRSNAGSALRAMSIGMSLRKSAVTGPELLKQLAQIASRPPVLLLWGRHDRLVPLDLGELIKSQYPWITLEVIENSGHCPHDEYPKEFNKHLLSWLSRSLVMDRKRA